MKRKVSQLCMLCMCSMLTLTGVSSLAFSDETELEDVISFEELAKAAAQGYDGNDIENDIYKEQDPSFVKEEVVSVGDPEETLETAAEETAAGEEKESSEAENETTGDAAEEESTVSAGESSIDTRDIFERSEFQIGFSNTGEAEGIHVDSYKESDLAGVLKPYGCVEIYSETEDGWYEVQAGSIYGYISKYVIASGDEAIAIANDVVYMSATPTAKKVKIRKGPSKDEEEIGVLKKGEEIEVLDPYGDWITVLTAEGETGYVLSDKVAVRKFYPSGMTLEEFERWYEERSSRSSEEEETGKQEEEQEEYSYEEEGSGQEIGRHQSYDTPANTDYNPAPYTAPETEPQKTDEPQQTEPAIQSEPQQTEPAAQSEPQQTEPAEQSGSSTGDPADSSEQGGDSDNTSDPGENSSSDPSSEPPVVVIDDPPDGDGEYEMYDDKNASDPGEVYEDENVDGNYDDGAIYEED